MTCGGSSNQSTLGYDVNIAVTVVPVNGRVRDECVNINLFWSLTQARVIISDWKDEYNNHRRHSSLGYLTLTSYAATCTHR